MEYETDLPRDDYYFLAFGAPWANWTHASEHISVVKCDYKLCFNINSAHRTSIECPDECASPPDAVYIARDVVQELWFNDR